MRKIDSPQEGARGVVVTTLEMRTPPTAYHAAKGLSGAAAPRCEIVTEGASAWSARMYSDVGAPWHWVDRLDWSASQWSEWTDRDEHLMLLGYTGSTPFGYAELEQQGKGAVEIAYFGLLPEFIGRGLGGWLLQQAITLAWDLPGTRSIWVHTCDLDGPAALVSYRARGMMEVSRHIEWRIPATDTVTV